MKFQCNLAGSYSAITLAMVVLFLTGCASDQGPTPQQLEATHVSRDYLERVSLEKDEEGYYLLTNKTLSEACQVIRVQESDLVLSPNLPAYEDVRTVQTPWVHAIIKRNTLHFDGSMDYTNNLYTVRVKLLAQDPASQPIVTDNTEPSQP